MYLFGENLLIYFILFNLSFEINIKVDNRKTPNQDSSKMHSQTRMEVDMEDRQQDNPTGLFNRPQVTAAQVETYQTMRTFVPERSQLEDRHNQLDSSHSASPVGQMVVTSLPRNTINNVHAVDQLRSPPDDRNSVNTGESHLKNIYHFIIIKVF